MFKTSMLSSDLGDYSDTYIVVKGRAIAAGIMLLTEEIISLPLRKMLCLDSVYQESVIHL